MTDTKGLRSALAPVVTPFNEDLRPGQERWIRHCRWLRTQDCGLAVFGTNSKANPFSLEEPVTLLSALVEAGLEPKACLAELEKRGFEMPGLSALAET
jgi:4-hydroxy-tetrahydrodipicolinate synthase